MRNPLLSCRRLFVIASLATLGVAMPAMASPPQAEALSDTAPADAIVGKWAPAPGIVIEIKKSGAGFTGVLTQNAKKPDAVGKEVLRNVKADAGGGSWSGELMNPQLGKYAPATLKISGGNLIVTGGSGTDAKTWTRA